MKKHELLSLLDEHDRLNSQLNALYKLMSIAGTQLSNDLCLASVSLCSDINDSKNQQYRKLHSAIMKNRGVN